MYNLTPKLRNLTPYDPICGCYKVRLDANESFVKIPNDTIYEAIAGIDLNRYPDPYAKAATDVFGRYYNVPSNLVTAGNGSDELISIITASFLAKEDKILTFKPDFTMYGFYSFLYELNTITMDKNSNLEIDMDAVIALVNSNDVKCVIFSNPCNPTSLGVKKDDIIKLITSTSALIVVDEAYMDFWQESESLLPLTNAFDNLIVLKTMSKCHALASIRLGFAVTDERKTVALRAAKSPYNVNSVTQAICVNVLSDTEAVKNRIKLVKDSIGTLYVTMKEKDFSFVEKIYETKTNFIYMKTEAQSIYNYLLNNSIAVRLMGDYLRISCGSEEENRLLIAAFEQYRGEK